MTKITRLLGPLAVASLIVLTACSDNANKPLPLVYFSSGCSLDTIHGSNRSSPTQFTMPAGAQVVMDGWIADVEAGQVPESISISIANKEGKAYLVGQGKAGTARPDVAKVFDKEALSTAGYSIKTDLNGIPAGAYTIHLLGTYKDKQRICVDNKEVVIQ
jgi:hypothetical protein